MKSKNIWRGVFAYRNKIERLFAYAYSAEQAKLTMCRRLAKLHGVPAYEVFAKFKDGNNYKIGLEIDFKEEANV